MKLQASQTIKTDVLVIGGGGAGLRAAIEAKRHGCNVLLVSESPVGFRNNTALSKATFIAGIKKPGDSPELYIEDTLAGGRFLNDLKMVKIAIREAEQQVSDLIKFGVNFKKKDGELLIGQETGHRYPRLVFGGSRRGIDLTMPLKDYAAKTGVKFTEGVLVSKLLQSEGALVGALAVNDKGQVFVFNAKSTILATGGLGELFQRHDNALGLTGDGYALAYELGITLRDMEFVQFYPTTWGNHGSKICPFEMYILEGATMWNSLGEDILKRHGIDNPVSVTRYRLMRIIMEEVAEGRGVEGGVTFDFTTILEKRKQELYRDGLLRKGEYPDKFQVAPAVHYFLGGVKINEKAETGINGLYAAGEVCGGMNGANRIGGNALVEMFVFGTIAGESAAVRASNVKLIPFSQREVKTEVERLTKFTSDNSRGDIEELRQSLKRTMWEKVGVIRDEKNLKEARQKIAALREQLESASISAPEQLPQAVKLSNMLMVAEMIGNAALMRTESRGAHYRSDYPEEDNKQWLKIIEVCRQKDKMNLSLAPVGGAEKYCKPA